MPEDPPVTRLGLIGDVMLGRFVDARVLGDLERDPAYLWGDLPALLETVDARLINLECVIASSGAPDPGKIFTFRARPRALDALAAAGVTFAGLANNHVLDYGPDALLECLGPSSARVRCQRVLGTFQSQRAGGRVPGRPGDPVLDGRLRR